MESSDRTGPVYIRLPKRFGPDMPVKEIPARFYCWRFVTHLLDDPNDHGSLNAAAAKSMVSLGHQMRYSIQMLQRELQDEGIVVDLCIEPPGDEPMVKRYQLNLDCQPVAYFDKDFGYDCFDASATAFKEKMREVVMRALDERAIDDLLSGVFGRR